MSTEPLHPGAIRAGAEYEAARSEARDRAIESRRRHRLDLGERLSLVFETPETLAAVIEETLRNERISAPECVAEEVSAANAAAPGAIGIAASVYLDVADAAELAGAVAEIEGLAAYLYLELAGERSHAELHGVAEEAGAPATLVVFPLSPQQRRDWQQGAEVRIGVDHPVLRAETVLSDTQRALLARAL